MAKRKRPVPVGELVERFLSSRKKAPRWRQEAETVKVVGAFQKIGPPVTGQAEPLLFRRGVLTLGVRQPVWMTELTFLRPMLIERLNEFLGKKMVTDVRLRALRGAKLNARPRPVRALSFTEKDRIRQWTRDISDLEVRRAVVRAATASLQGPSRRPPPTGPAGPRVNTELPEPPEEKGLTYGWGDRDIDRFAGVDHFKVRATKKDADDSE